MTAPQWLEVISSYSVQVLLVVGVAFLVDRNTPDSQTRSSIWSTLFWTVIAMACVAVLLPRLRLLRPWSTLRPESMLTIVESEAMLGKTFLSIWCLGAGVVLLRWVRRGALLRGMLSRCEAISEEDAERLSSWVPTGGKMCPDILVSDEIDGPFCWQFHRPTIVLPRFLLQGSDEDVSHVLVHEYEHLTTQHPLQLFLQHAVQVLCWFHPAVWRATRHASVVREFTCDDAAVELGANTAAYLRTLLRIAERCEANQGTLGFGRSSSEIVLRSRRLVRRASESPAPQRFTLSPVVATATLIVAAFLATQLWLPVDVLASSRTVWSPWPTWTSRSLHALGINARDYEPFDHRTLIHELREDELKKSKASAVSRR